MKTLFLTMFASMLTLGLGAAHADMIGSRAPFNIGFSLSLLCLALSFLILWCVKLGRISLYTRKRRYACR